MATSTLDQQLQPPPRIQWGLYNNDTANAHMQLHCILFDLLASDRQALLMPLPGASYFTTIDPAILATFSLSYITAS
jgi:hypothetical protein